MRVGEGFHGAKVAAIAAAVRERAERGATSHISKGGVPHFVPLPGDKRQAGRPIDVSSLNQILDIDP